MAEALKVGEFEVTVYPDGGVWVERASYPPERMDGEMFEFEQLERIYLAAKELRGSTA